MQLQCLLVAALAGGPAKIEHWRVNTEETSAPKLIATRVDFASVQPFCESLLLKETDTAVQVRVFLPLRADPTAAGSHTPETPPHTPTVLQVVQPNFTCTRVCVADCLHSS
jgi:hypothetical protein